MNGMRMDARQLPLHMQEQVALYFLNKAAAELEEKTGTGNKENTHINVSENNDTNKS